MRAWLWACVKLAGQAPCLIRVSHLLPHQRPGTSQRPLFAVGLPRRSGPSGWLGTAAAMQRPTKKIADNSLRISDPSGLSHLSCRRSSHSLPAVGLLFSLSRRSLYVSIRPPSHRRVRSVSRPEIANRNQQVVPRDSGRHLVCDCARVLVCSCARVPDAVRWSWLSRRYPRCL